MKPTIPDAWAKIAASEAANTCRSMGFTQYAVLIVYQAAPGDVRVVCEGDGVCEHQLAESLHQIGDQLMEKGATSDRAVAPHQQDDAT